MEPCGALRWQGPHLYPLISAKLCEAMVRAILLGQPHDQAHPLQQPAAPTSPRVVRLVEEYVDAHAAEPIRTSDLARLTGASGRSIEAAFRAHRGLTVAAFLRTKRLRLAQQLLARPDATVASVAQASGFSTAGASRTPIAPSSARAPRR